MLSEVLKTCVSAVTISAALRLSTPIIIGSVGGCFNEKTSTGNLAYECFMLTGAFFGALGAYLYGNPLMGALFGMLSGLCLAIIYGILVYHLNCNPMIVSVAYNTGSWAITTLLLVTVWGKRGFFRDPAIVSFTPVNFAFLNNFTLLNEIFNNQISLVYFAYIFAIIGYIVMYKTSFGLRLRGVGINATASQAAGVNVRKYRWICLIIMSVSMGLAGAYMPLSGLSMFSENMTTGRGFLCLTSILVGRGHPLKTTLVAMLFGYASSLTLVFSSFNIPTQIMNMLPYFAVVFVLILSGIRSYKGSVDISSDSV